jgi:broad specificity phosphatase PhoE
VATLILMRHGQIAANRQRRWHGSTDSPLTWRGRRQVRTTIRHLRRHSPDMTAIYTSPLLRCRQTADAVAAAVGLEPIVLEDLREFDIGEWEDLPFQTLHEEHDFPDRAAGEPDFRPPGGESLREVAERIVPALQSIHQSHPGDDRVLVVGHGVALGVAVGALLHGDPGRWSDYQLANCSLTELMLSPTPYVNVFNSTQHL